MNLFYYSPLLIAKISHLTRDLHKNTINYQSEYGTTSGTFSPNEGGKVWDHLIFNKNVTHYIPSGFCSEEQINNIRKTILGIQNITAYPFLSKNPYLSLALNPINEAFPRAIYIVITRDPAYNAQSLYLGRLKRKRSLDHMGWFSCKPKEYEQICTLDSIEQSVKQIYFILKQIDDDREFLEDNMIWIRYEDLCNKPAEILEMIDDFMKKHALNVSERDDFVLPTIISRNERKIESHLFNKIEREVDSTFNGWKPEISKSIY